jgi:hypothetical protein
MEDGEKFTPHVECGDNGVINTVLQDGKKSTISFSNSSY